MDIASGLTAAASALGVIKQLKEIDASFNQAEIKAKMADLYGQVADVKMALSDAKEAVHERDGEIRRLNELLRAKSKGQTCLICEVGELKVATIEEHPDFGFAGYQQHSLKCTNCGHTEKRKVKP